MKIFLGALKNTFGGEIRNDEKTLEAFSRDTSLFRVKPRLVVSPKDGDDVRALVSAVRVARAKGENVSLTARAAGTDMTGGPLTESVVVNFLTHMDMVSEVGSGFATTEPGAYYHDFEKRTLARGWLFPSYPASREIAAMGGIVMNNAGGEKSLSYGKTADYIESLTMVLADGNTYEFKRLSQKELEEKKRKRTFEGTIYRRMERLLKKNKELLAGAKPHVSKNSAGYALWDVIDPKTRTFDLTRVLVGSQGTLGLMTKARLRLIRPQNHTRTLVIFLRDLSPLGELTKTLLLEHPECVESYDDKTVTVALKYMADIVKRLRGNLFTLALSFMPEFWAVLTGGMPKLIIIAEFTAATDSDAYRKAAKAERAIAHFGLKTRITESMEESAKYWTVRRESFNLLRKHTKHRRTAPFIDDIVVRPEKLPEFLPKLYALLDRYGDRMIYTIAGHVGDGNFHIIPLMDLTDPRAVKAIKELGEKVYDLVFSFGGSMTGEHNDGLTRSHYLSRMFGPKVYKLFEETKKIFDPNNIFNPRKKVGGSATYAEKHIDRMNVH